MRTSHYNKIKPLRLSKIPQVSSPARSWSQQTFFSAKIQTAFSSDRNTHQTTGHESPAFHIHRTNAAVQYLSASWSSLCPCHSHFLVVTCHVLFYFYISWTSALTSGSKCNKTMSLWRNALLGFWSHVSCFLKSNFCNPFLNIT